MSLQGDSACKILIPSNLRTKYLFCWSCGSSTLSGQISFWQQGLFFNCTGLEGVMRHVKNRDWSGFCECWGLTRILGAPCQVSGACSGYEGDAAPKINAGIPSPSASAKRVYGYLAL